MEQQVIVRGDHRPVQRDRFVSDYVAVAVSLAAIIALALMLG